MVRDDGSGAVQGGQMAKRRMQVEEETVFGQTPNLSNLTYIVAEFSFPFGKSFDTEKKERKTRGQ